MEKKKEKKRLKKANDEKRYRELQIETNRRLARRESGTAPVVNSPDTFQSYEDLEEEDENLRSAVNDTEPPPYEDAVQVQERRESEWRAQMQRRRSSAYSAQSGGGGSAGIGLVRTSS